MLTKPDEKWERSITTTTAAANIDNGVLKLPTTGITREVTRQDMDCPSSFQYENDEGQDHDFSESFESDTSPTAKKDDVKTMTNQQQYKHLNEKDYQRSYSSDCPLLFQSALSTTLSSLSKGEHSSSDELEESCRNNKNSIFRPRQETAPQSPADDEMRTKTDSISMPNLLSRSSLDMTRLASEVKSNLSSDIQYIANTSDLTSSFNHNKGNQHFENNLDVHVADDLGKSLDYSLNDGYPEEVVVDETGQKAVTDNSDPHIDSQSSHENESDGEQISQEVEKKSSPDDLRRFELYSFYKELKEHWQALTDLTFPLPGLKPFIFGSSKPDVSPVGCNLEKLYSFHILTIVSTLNKE